MSSNLIADVAAEVEKAGKDQALARLNELAMNIEENYFRIGGLLLRIKEEGEKDKNWLDGHDSIVAFAHEKYGYGQAKTYELMRVYETLVTKQIPGSVIGILGWTKLRLLSGVLTQQNLNEWIERAKPLTVRELEAVLKAKPENEGGTVNTTDEMVKVKLNFKADQWKMVVEALSRAKAEFGVDNDAAALTAICQWNLDGGVVPITKESTSALMLAAGWEATLTVLDELFPDIDFKVTLPPDLDIPTVNSSAVDTAASV